MITSVRKQQKRQKSREQLGELESKKMEGEGVWGSGTIRAGRLAELAERQAQAALPASERMFPWLHGYVQDSAPRADKFALSVVRSQPLDAATIENSGILRASMDLHEVLLTVDNTEAERAVDAALEEYGAGVCTARRAELLAACQRYQLLPFLQTDALKQCRYGSRRLRLGDKGSWRQPGMFRRFDLQPARHVELSSVVVVYCLANMHPDRCCCHDAATILQWACRFVALNYPERAHLAPEVLILEDPGHVPASLVGTAPMALSSLQKPFPAQLVSRFDVASFNNWERDLLYKERLEISKMSSMSMIEDCVMCGNATDFEVLRLFRSNGAACPSTAAPRKYYSPDNTIVLLKALEYQEKDGVPVLDSVLFNLPPSELHDVQLFVSCTEHTPFPHHDDIRHHLTQMEAPIHIAFPSSGSIGLGTLTLDSITSCVNICHLIYRFSAVHKKLSLLYCSDGYTETSFLLVAYLIFAWDQPLDEVLLRLHTEVERPYFLFPIDIQVLGHLQLLLRDMSPLRHPNRGPELLAVDPDLFSRMFFTKPSQDSLFLKSKGPLPSRILPHLYLGSLEHAHDPNLLRRLGIRNIVSVGETLSWLQSPHSREAAKTEESKQETITDAYVTAPAETAAATSTTASTGSLNLLKRNRSPSAPEIKPLKSSSCKTTVFSKDGFEICHTSNLGDNGADPMLTQLDQMLSFINRCYEAGEKVLVHCMVGVSRSATVCIAECMRRLNCAVIQAYLFVRVRRLNIIIQPNLMFIYELLKWQELKHPDVLKIDWHIMCRAINELNSNYIKDMI
ncbi:AEL160Cp [Eremothecium gossypii ATCC 10895]|uniref:AEL160Cp n=1 Tax=Eremothecium gossypii (strain ATCC 10895 / CBS 109.51 / FGSC 9923 / NRRL Y-1056) TaxID=284811 RepID=Q758B2_EREGS|nr:AEL160Cp [Eremothecium gossypii ATCC 10895]AAS52525.1 AEL160Cp [Eremothecium gossypii ATCC 10895]AEY96825.1 FAEL160Cp [Eremothecium gossypii FDAG1]